MLVFDATIEIEGKPDPKPWKDDAGNERLSYKLNVSQNEGRDVATVKCDEKIYNSVRRHDVVKAVFLYSEINGRTNLKLDSVTAVPVPFVPTAKK